MTNKTANIARASLAILLMPGQIPWASAQAPRPVGPDIYVVVQPGLNNGNPRLNQFKEALANPGVDGAVIIANWSDLEPHLGVYNWSLIDQWIQQVANNGKSKVSIGIVAGKNTPAWVYENASNITFTYNNQPRGEPNCLTATVPIPWDKAFIAQYSRTMSDLSAHLRAQTINHRSAYDYVRIIKVGGINLGTEELRLGAAHAVDAACRNSNVNQTWANAGFTPGKVVYAWSKIADNIATAFPDKILSNDIIATGGSGFPPIDDTGKIGRPMTPIDATTRQIVALGLSKYNGRFAVQWDALADTAAAASPVAAQLLALSAQGAILAWQGNERMGAAGGSGCSSGNNSFVPCTNAGYYDLLQNGIALKGQWIEVWAPNVLAFPGAAQRAHQSYR